MKMCVKADTQHLMLQRGNARGVAPSVRCFRNAGNCRNTERRCYYFDKRQSETRNGAEA